MKCLKFDSLIFCLVIVVIFLLSSCKREQPLKSYSVNLRAQGSSLKKIWFQSAQRSFEEANVPLNLWAADNQFWGDDTLRLYAQQTRDTLNPVIVTISVAYNQEPLKIFSDSDAVQAMIEVYLPK